MSKYSSYCLHLGQMMLRVLSFSSGDKMADKANINNKPDNADLETSTSEGDLCRDEAWCVVICHTVYF